jgi:hypothetical protein
VHGYEWWVDDAHHLSTLPPGAGGKRIAVFPRNKLVIVISTEIDLREPTLRGIG